MDTTAPLSPAPLPPLRLDGASPDALGPGARRVLVGSMLGAHLLAGWALLQVPAVREAAAEVAPMMVDLIAPTPEAPKPPPPPQPRPKTPPPPPAPVLAAKPPPVPVPQPAFVAPPPPAEPPPLPVPEAPPVPPAPPAPPTPPAPAPAAPRTVVLTDSDWVRVPEIEYPLASRRLKEEGTVIVRALIDTRGTPKQVALQRSSGHARLDQAALRAAMGARVKPRTENGVPFEFWIAMPLAFELE
ncbi:energy transducer TonB [Sphaerotilus natans]|uniref:energy transducer TonB n=1 Tax=Sphaerotilus natans TaxID=34103 RepID=UPI00406CBC0D